MSPRTPSPSLMTVKPATSGDTRETITHHPDHPAPSSSEESQAFQLCDSVSRSLRPPEFDLGRFNLLGEIGRGGMGVVFKAKQKDLDRVVAVKMILASHLASPEQVERFYAEARAAARLRHPHIVGIHEVGEYRGQHYFTMEYIEGRSLAQALRKGPMSPEDSARLVMTVARAVHYLHRQGLVHRDLKPSNILMDHEARPFVSDFGLAKVLEGDGRSSSSGTIVGTPNYMAPEQALGHTAEVGPCSDVYSLGAILYEVMTGQPPHQGDAPYNTLIQVVEGEPDRPRGLNPRIPRALEQVCLKALEKAPADRYVSADALADDLDHLLRGEQVQAARTGPLHRMRRWARREPALVSRLGTMALCASIIQINRLLIGDSAPDSRRVFLVILCWAAACMVFQLALRRGRWTELGRMGWAVVDVAAFTVLVYVTNGIPTSLVSGFFLLVAASGLWFRERNVWLTTLLSMASYGGLAIAYEQSRLESEIEGPYRHVIFATVLAVCGLIVSYQIRRVRALSQYYDHRPLP
jgi:eukaryotic-like serine/threonine-protein kinase